MENRNLFNTFVQRRNADLRGKDDEEVKDKSTPKSPEGDLGVVTPMRGFVIRSNTKSGF